MTRALWTTATLTLALALGAPIERAAAADLDTGATEAIAGVPCESAEANAFPSVWLGHFQGGYSHYLGPGQSIVLDWRDERLCFPSQRTCRRYIAEMRHDFHRPEGYFTCLPIR